LFAELEDYDVGGLKTLGAFFDGEFHPLTFFQGVITFALDGGMMNEYVGAIFLSQEAITLAIIEPLDGTYYTICHFLDFLF
jgi:hypothetical protein